VVADEDSPSLEVLQAFHLDRVPKDPQLQKVRVRKFRYSTHPMQQF
jgi:hypothetical protein